VSPANRSETVEFGDFIQPHSPLQPFGNGATHSSFRLLADFTI